VTRADRS
jgi:hypothetical protein